MANSNGDDPKLYLDGPPEGALLPSEISNIDADVQKQVDRELRDKAKAAYREQALKRAREARGVAEPTEDVVIDLPLYADRILIDNVAYLQGMQYTVKAGVAALMREMMQNAWEHQSIIDGKPENFYRRSRETRVGPAGIVNGSAMLRA